MSYSADKQVLDIVDDGASIRVSQTGLADSYIPKAGLRIEGLFMNNPTEDWNISSTHSQTQIKFTFQSGQEVTIELQSVKTPATWNLGTQASLNVAMADINSWL